MLYNEGNSYFVLPLNVHGRCAERIKVIDRVLKIVLEKFYSHADDTFVSSCSEKEG